MTAPNDAARSVPVPAPSRAAPQRTTTVPAPATPRGFATLLVGFTAALLGTLCTVRLWFDPAGSMVSGNIPDATHYTWWLAHTPFAVLHGQDPFTTTAMNWPQGVGTMNNTTLMLPSILLYPITWLSGSLATLNVLNALSVPACIGAAFWALRQPDVVPGRLGERLRVPAALAGAVTYGISPAIVNSLVGHVTMSFAPGLPVLLVLGVRTWRSPRPWRAGLLLGIAATIQVFIGEEVLFQAGFASLVLLLTAAVSRPGQILTVLPRLLRALAAAVVIVLVVAGYALYQQFLGPLSQHGNPFLPNYYGSDLTSFVTTSDRLLLHTSSGIAATKLFPGGIEEHLSYLGVPLLLLCLLMAVTGWRRLTVRCVSVALAVSLLLSLGGLIWVRGVQSTWHGPYALLQALPVTEASLATRLGLPAALFAGVLLALALQGLLAPPPVLDPVLDRAAWDGGSAARDGGAGARGVGAAAWDSGAVARDGGEADRDGAAALDGERQPAWARPAGLQDDAREPDGPIARRVAATGPRLRSGLAGLLALACLAPLVPTVLPVQKAAAVPAWFTTTARTLPDDPVVVVLPYPVPVNPVAMRWQIAADFAFDMPGGYFLGPGPDGHAYVGGGADPILATVLADVARTGQARTMTPGLRAQATADLAAWRPQAIVLGPDPAHDALRTTLVALLGQESVQTGGVDVWTDPAGMLQ